MANPDIKIETSFVQFSKREYFAGLAMQSIIQFTAAKGYKLGSVEELGSIIAKYSVIIADALLKELEKNDQV